MEENMTNIIPFIPDVTPATIAEDEVTITRLSGLLEAAFIDHTIDEDGDIYVTDGVDFPLWVQIDTDRKLLELFTCCSVDDKQAANWVNRVNDMNRETMVSQFSYGRDAIWGHYWMTYDGGLSVRQFVKMLRAFSGAFQAGVLMLESESKSAPQKEAVELKVVTLATSSDVTPASKSEGPADAA
jgi:hypothetical protein